ncbi:MAG: hypothetical protein JW940_22940 [Polyangiaceae bacterium]|nr:hypothetical protein [Polyangiaceae bacterium]
MTTLNGHNCCRSSGIHAPIVIVTGSPHGDVMHQATQHGRVEQTNRKCAIRLVLAEPSSLGKSVGVSVPSEDP